MNDTRETYYNFGTTTPEQHPCRFREGDKVLFPLKGEVLECVAHSVYWDDEFGGWRLTPGLIGVHEQNFILVTEHDQWVLHKNGLWSWWERKTGDSDG